MSMAMDKGEKPVVGQRLRWKHGKGWPQADFVVTHFDGDTITVQYQDGDLETGETYQYGWAKFSSDAVVVAPSPSSPGRPGRDWSKWLPPREPDRNRDVVYKSGQVWALRWDEPDYSMVFRVVRAGKTFGGRTDNHYLDVESLAGKKGSGGFSNRDYTERAVLVADVGCEPTPPEVLYGPRSSTQGEPRAADKVSCVDCAADITDRVKAAVVGGGWRCVPCNGEFHARVILAKRKPASTVTSKPLREVYAGGAWLDYERLSDPDPFHLYKRRRENGVEVAAVEPTGYGGLTFREAANRDGIASRIMKADDYGRSMLSSKPAALTSWLATDAKPPQVHPYSKPSSPGGGE